MHTRTKIPSNPLRYSVEREGDQLILRVEYASGHRHRVDIAPSVARSVIAVGLLANTAINDAPDPEDEVVAEVIDLNAYRRALPKGRAA